MGVSVSDGFLSTIQAILEALLKGIANLAISISNKGASAYLGVLQIFGAFWITAGSFPNILVRIISVTYKFFNDPVGFSNSQINHFLNLAKRS